MENMKRKTGKLLALVLALMMIVSSLPVASFAAFDTANCDLSLEGRTEFYSPDSTTCYESFRFFNLRKAQYEGSFGNQLSDETLSFYNAMVKNYVTERKTGNFIYTPSENFSYVLQYSKKAGDYINRDELDIFHAAACAVVFDSCDAFSKDYPEIFWFRNASFSSTYNTVPDEKQWNDRKVDIVDVTVYVEITLKPIEIYSGSSNDIAVFDSAVNKLTASMNEYFGTFGSEITRKDMLKYMHDYICNNSDYDTASLSDPTDLAAHSAQPFFIGDKLHVCEGYSKVLKILCDRFGIPCVCVSGNTKDFNHPDDRDYDGGHMWNYVQMEDGKWYLIDITWDDQDLKIYDTYFLADWNTKGFYFDTIADERYETYIFSTYQVNGVKVNGREFAYPTLSSEKYNGHTHSWIDYEIIKAPSCKEPGEKLLKCSSAMCQSTKTVEIPVDSNLHKYESVITKKATHLEEGLETFTCVCGDSYTKPIAKISEHTYTSVVIKKATHLEEGLEALTCVCGDNYTKPISKIAEHTYSSVVIKQATHLEEGLEALTCICGDNYTKPIAKLPGHTYTSSVKTAPTCTEKGYTTYKCDCGYSYDGDYVNAKSHNFENGKCTKCGDSKAASCSHMCHKNNFIWKLLKFFFKLFRIQPVCECGVKHY